MKAFVALTTIIMILSNLACDVEKSIEDVASIVYEENFYSDEDEYIEDLILCSVDLSNISLGDIIPCTEIDFKNQNCAEIFINLLEDEGYTPIYSGTTDEGFYLSSVAGIDTSNISITDDLIEYLTEKGVKYSNEVYFEDELSEFDLTDASGWIYMINGEIPSMGMCDYIPNPGDEIKLCFTLYYGEDLLR